MIGRGGEAFKLRESDSLGGDGIQVFGGALKELGEEFKVAADSSRD
jgi:hypothetical protein